MTARRLSFIAFLVVAACALAGLALALLIYAGIVMPRPVYIALPCLWFCALMAGIIGNGLATRRENAEFLEAFIQALKQAGRYRVVYYYDLKDKTGGKS